jgi:predicted nucleic acid-binding protein
MNRFIVDSSVHISALLDEDSQHKLAIDLLKKCNLGTRFVNPLIVSEVATVLLIKTKNLSFASQSLEKLFFLKSAPNKVQSLTSSLWQASYEVFINQESNKLSFADCSLIAQTKCDKQKTAVVTLDKSLIKEFSDEVEFVRL